MKSTFAIRRDLVRFPAVTNACFRLPEPQISDHVLTSP